MHLRQAFLLLCLLLALSIGAAACRPASTPLPPVTATSLPAPSRTPPSAVPSPTPAPTIPSPTLAPTVAPARWRTFSDTKHVLEMAFDRQGQLWAASRSGAVRWNVEDGARTVYTADDGLASKDVQCLAVATDGALWFGTSRGGVSRFDGEHWTTYTADDGLADNRIQDIAVGPDGALWFATFGGVSRFDGERWITYTPADGLAGERVLSVAVDADGALWFGTFGDGVSYFDGDSWTTYTTDDGLADDRVRAIAVDPYGVLWFGTFGGGLSRLDMRALRAGARDEAWTTYTALDGLAEDVISCMALAPDGTLWIGVADNGISHFDDSGWMTYTAAHGLMDNEIRSVVIAPDGVVWASSIDGVSYLSSPD